MDRDCATELDGKVRGISIYLILNPIVGLQRLGVESGDGRVYFRQNDEVAFKLVFPRERDGPSCGWQNDPSSGLLPGPRLYGQDTVKSPWHLLSALVAGKGMWKASQFNCATLPT